MRLHLFLTQILLFSAAQILHAANIEQHPPLSSYLDFDKAVSDRFYISNDILVNETYNEIDPKFLLEENNSITVKKEGLQIKMPSISANRPPPIDDNRPVIQEAYRKQWAYENEKNGASLDLNPMNINNYKLVFEAEFNF